MNCAVRIARIMPPKQKQTSGDKLLGLLREVIPAKATIDQVISQSEIPSSEHQVTNPSNHDPVQVQANVKQTIPITPALISAMHQFVIYGTDEGFGVNIHDKKGKKKASQQKVVIDRSEIPTEEEIKSFHESALKLPLMAAIASMLLGHQNEPVPSTIFSVRSLALCCLGRLITLDADFKLTLLTTYSQLIPLILDSLHEKSPVTHHAVLNLLVEFSTLRELTPLITLKDLALILSIYEFHSMVDVSQRGSDTIDAQMSVRVFAMAFLGNFSEGGGLELVSKTEALGFAVAAMQTETQRDLLIQSLKLIYLMIYSTEQLRQQVITQLGNIGYLLALTSHPDQHVSGAAKVVLKKTPLGESAASGETNIIDALALEQLIVYETRLKQIQPPALRQRLEREYYERMAVQQMSFPSQQSQKDTFHNHQCARCGKQEPTEESAKKFAVCSQCKSIRYCSKDCQVAHWKQGHKNICKKQAQ